MPNKVAPEFYGGMYEGMRHESVLRMIKDEGVYGGDEKGLL
jgi:hypothetical protein